MAALHVREPAPWRDALIGATALVHQMTGVTRNVKDVVRFDGLDVIDPRSAGCGCSSVDRKLGVGR